MESAEENEIIENEPVTEPDTEPQTEPITEPDTEPQGEPTQADLLKERIPYDESIFESEEIYNKTINRLLEDAKEDALSLRYPYKDTTDMELPLRYYNWQLRCAEELYNLIGSINIKSYSENGLNWTRDTAYLSTYLVNKIEPIIGYIQEEEDADESTE